MKVGIITYHNPLNYGAQLQAYGLQETLRGLGHDPQIINYRGERYESVRICDFLRVRKPSYHVSLWNEAVKAKAFERNPMPFSLTSRTYETFSELYETPPGCEAYICGSDQIWQPKNNVDGRVVRCEFFLDFAEDGAKRIAYAPSFGQPLTDEYVSAIAPYVRKLDSISIREPDELERLKEATGRKDIDCVCDPTILLGADGFRSLCSERRSKCRRGLFCYMLSTDTAKDIAVIKAVSRRYGSATIVSRPFRLMFCGRNVGLGPQEWLFAIDNADFVATNSFHGTAFSLLFHKPFICLSWANKARNIRMRRLLDSVGLSSRMICHENASAAEEIASCEIDWSMVDEKLAAMRSHSMGYLQSALGVSG